MRDYEFVFVAKATETDEALDALVEETEKTAKDLGAEVITVDRWGRRKLAYEIKKQREGYYALLQLRCSDSKAIDELDRRFKLNDAILRHLAIRIDFDQRRHLRRTELRAKKKGVAAETLSQPLVSGFRRDSGEDFVVGDRDEKSDRGDRGDRHSDRSDRYSGSDRHSDRRSRSDEDEE